MLRVTSNGIRPALSKQYVTSRSLVSPHEDPNHTTCMSLCSGTMVVSVSSSDEREPLVSNAENETENTDASSPKLDKLKCILLMMSAFISYAMASGFNLGIAAAMVKAESSAFNISLPRSSLTTSIHTGVYLMSSK